MKGLDDLCTFLMGKKKGTKGTPHFGAERSRRCHFLARNKLLRLYLSKVCMLRSAEMVVKKVAKSGLDTVELNT